MTEQMQTRPPVIVPIDQVKPYENNPRVIPESAVAAVAQSIERYGWQQPIVVDSDYVIIVGHTRRQAAISLGLTEVPVLVVEHLSEEQVREYRLVDNRTSEMSGWDYDSLVIELREFDQGLLDTYFSDVRLEIAQVESAATPTEKELELAQDRASRITEAADEALHTTKVECPSCYVVFDVRTKSLPGMDLKSIAELTGGGAK